VNAQTAVFVREVLASSSAAALRDDLLDAFFDFELAIARWLSWLGDKDSNSPFGQRLQKLADHPDLRAKAGPKQTRNIRALPKSCEDLVKLRNLAVHSRLDFGHKDGEDCILFETITLALKENNEVVPIEIQKIASCAQDLRSVAKNLVYWLAQAKNTNPSSPPQPSPGAGGDP
jgi:hypothetical protein